MHTPETELHERGLRARLHERSVGICRRFLHEVRAPIGDGKVLEKMGERRKYVRRDATVERLSAIFLEDMEGSVKPSTLACYRRNIQCHILPVLGECVAAELTAAEINDYIQQLQEDYSPKLVREIGGLLLRIVGMAGVGYGEDVTLPKVRQKAVEVFTEPELKQMGQVILRRPDRTGLGVLLTAYTGLRLGELCGLQWQDVDVGAGLLHIQRTVERIAQIGGGTCLTVQPPKTENSERWIPIPKEMLRMLKPETKQPDSYLLTGGEIVPDPRAMQYRYKVLLERCGVRYRNFHCLRHSYATRCVERGVDVKSVSELLGPHHAAAVRPLVHGLQAQGRGGDRLSQGNNVKKDAERRPFSKKWHKNFRKVTYFAKTFQFQPNNSIYQPFFRVNNEF